MKRILVPTDFSECADRAIDFAAHLARKTNGEIYLLHAFENEEAFVQSGSEESENNKETSPLVSTTIRTLEDTKKSVREIMDRPGLSGITVFDILEVGIPAQCITEMAKKYNTDIIIMGTHGSGGLKELFVGSNAERVSQHAGCPVLSIKHQYNAEPKTILFPSDFNDEADFVFEYVRMFAGIYGATIHLLKVIVPENFESELESRATINAFQKRHSVSLPSSIYNDHVEESGIRHFARQIQADIIALGSHGYHGIKRLFNGNITEDLINHSNRPVLTIHFKK